MGVKAAIKDAGKVLEIAVSGNFQFAVYREFREAYGEFTQTGAEVHVNLAEATYMDSAALGILMLLREHAVKYQQKVRIDAVPHTIRRILEIASFDKLFSIA
jgi:anti-anti-sigma factor